MANYRSRRESASWQERTCCVCACVYRYPGEVDLSPCPSCGRYQSEMVGKLRFKWHALALLADVIWFYPLFSTFLWMSRGAALITTAVFAIPLILAHVWIITGYPNHRASANKARARFLISQGKLEATLDSAKKPEQWTTPASVQPGRLFWILLTLTCASLILFSACDVLRRVNGWPANPGWVPEVAGPGDTSSVDIAKPIHSLKGHWKGTATATLHVVDDPKIVIPLKATVREDSWGDNISVNKIDQSQETTLWARIELPNDAALEGKKVRIHFKMKVAYPTMRGGNEFVIKEEMIEHTADAQLATSRAGAFCNKVWFASMLIPFFVLVFMQLYCLVRAHNLKASVAAVAVVGAKPKDEDADEDGEDRRPSRRKEEPIDDEDEDRGRFR